MKKEREKETISAADKVDNSKLLDLLLNHLRKEHNFSDNQINDLIKTKIKEERMMIPVSIFNNDLSSLEIIVKYLHENLGMTISNIAKALNRSVRTIYTTYQNANDKFPKRLNPSKDERYLIPAEKFSNRKFSPLESAVKFLKEDYGLSIHEIAIATKRNPSTVWTVYNRIQKKSKR